MEKDFIRGVFLAPDTGVPEVRFEDVEDDEVDIIIGEPEEVPDPDAELPEGYRGLTKADLVAKMEINAQEMESLRGKSSEAAAIQAGIEALGEKLTPTQQRQMVPQAPRESEEEYQTRFNEKFFDNPYEMMKDFQMKKLAPELQQLMGNNLVYAKRDIMRDPDYVETYKKYEGEIEEYVQGLDPMAKLRDPDVYHKAHDLVIGRHWKEVLAQEVDKAVAAKTVAVVAPTPPPYTPAGGAAPASSGKKQVRVSLTPEEKERARKIGSSEEQYARYLARKRGLI